MKNHHRAQLFYDGRCPLCVKEMVRLGALKNDDLELVDIHALPAGDTLPDAHTLLRTLHLKTPAGNMLTGVEANVAAWQYTRHGHWLRWMRWPLFRPLADRFYDFWARWRYNRLYRQSCSTDKGSCDAP
ncbi:thiol-disulfide oxidoreductase DCC family protein [Pseudohalioglobus lutimaris]|uniref:DUF393 domain-containing protein n=1 Tax=Pseudohalioglobus lutimaris TaxID=1737061 RepID=A0A2N5X8A9_9GAMM|nr:DUF393 domain-containing protein [Pseudohalioglobus lutimaris]PLW70716.1 DUF393 domain-containing protein [Pseudohalioglobus lutimaris]